MFTICSLCIHCMFTICSLYVHYMFTICSLYVHYMFTICSLYIHYIFTVYSPYVHCIFLIDIGISLWGKKLGPICVKHTERNNPTCDYWNSQPGGARVVRKREVSKFKS